MESRMERKNIVNIGDSGSKLSFFISREPSDTLYSTKIFKNQGLSTKDYETYDRSTMQAIFEKVVSIPKYRKLSLLHEIEEKTVARQVDNQEVKIKKLRKILDLKKQVQVKIKDSKTKLIINKMDANYDEQILIIARARLQQYYETIKRILHDQDNYLHDLYLAQSKPDEDTEQKLASANNAVIKASKSTTPDINKSFETTVHVGKRVAVEETTSDASLTNDFYDYTKAPLTERHILDIARRKANWTDRRVFNQSANECSSIYNLHIPIVSNAVRRASELTHAPTTKFSINVGDPNAQQAQTQPNDPSSSKRYSIGRAGHITLSAKKSIVVDKGKHELFPGINDDMKGISTVSRKTIQYMNSKNESKKDSKTNLNKNFDPYIWYLIDPNAKRKYNLFLQKSTTDPTKSDSKDLYSSIQLHYNNT